VPYLKNEWPKVTTAARNQPPACYLNIDRLIATSNKSLVRNESFLFPQAKVLAKFLRSNAEGSGCGIANCKSGRRRLACDSPVACSYSSED
jgi:hypothetical protein